MPGAPRSSTSVLVLATALLLGGLRDPRLGALGEAAVCVLLWLERPVLGPALWWLPWLGWAALATAFGLQPLAGLPVLARCAAAIAYLSLAAAWNERDRGRWLKSIVAVAVVLAAASLWTGHSARYNWTMTGLLQPYYNYSMFALAGIGAAAAAWACHRRGPRGAWRWAAAVVAALAGSCALLAHSRGATLGLAAGAAVWALRRWRGRAAAALAALAAAAGAAVLLGRTPAAVRAAALKTDRPYEDARPGIWRAAAASASEHPWLGAGPGDFGVVFLRRPVELKGAPARWTLTTPFAHSEPLNAAAETGWAGMLLWLAALAACLAPLARGAGDDAVRDAAAVAAAAMLPQLFVDNMLQVPGLAFLFFSALGVAARRPEGGTRWPRAAAAALGALALAAWIPRALADASPVRAAALFPAEPGPREDLAYAATEAGRTGLADRLWAEAAERAPFDAIYPWRRAQVAAVQGRWADAEALAGAAVALEPGFTSARVLRAEALARLGRKPEARAELAEALSRRDPRLGRLVMSGYDKTIVAFDEKEFARVLKIARGR